MTKFSSLPILFLVLFAQCTVLWGLSSATTTTANSTTPVAPSASTDTSAPSTQAPTTIHTDPPVTTAAPVLEAGNWTVSEDGVTCIYLHAVITINMTSSKSIVVPVSAVANGSCGLNNGSLGDPERLNLMWDAYMLTFVFNATGNRVFLKELAFTAGKTVFDKSNFTSEMISAKTRGYKCDAGLGWWQLTSDSSGTASVMLEKLQWQAFVNSTSLLPQASVDDCAADDTSDLIPIIVGACLAALVVIVLIAYLIGRARSQREGYQSV